jgi:chromosome condensin MukBEF complex kleisin-like MukF subunit
VDDVTDDRSDSDMVEIERWLAEQDLKNLIEECPLNVDETAGVIRELLDYLCVLGEVPVDTLYVAADTEGLGRYAMVLRVLTSLAEHLDAQDG